MMVLALAALLVMAWPLAAQQEELARKSQAGKEAMAAGRFAEAARIYHELAKAVPGNPGLLLNLGMALHIAGEDARAIPPLRQALGIEPNIPPAWLFLGASLKRLGKAQEAIEPLRKFLGVDGTNPGARQLLAEALYDLERFEEAAAEYRRLADSAPQSPQAWYGLGKSYEALANSSFSKLPVEGPEAGYWLALIGEARLEQQQHRSAFYFYREALDLQPDLPGLHTALAEVYRQAGHTEWAQQEMGKERNPAPEECRARKLACDFGMGRFAEVAAAPQETPEALYWKTRAYNQLAIQAFGRLTSLPPSLEVHTLMGEIRRAQGRYPESLDHWKQARKLAPDDRELERELAVAHFLAGDYRTAEQMLAAMLDNEPDSALLNRLLGDTYLNQELAQKAIPYLEKALRRNPSMADTHGSLARAYIAAGRGKEAIPHLETALPTDADGSLHYQLSRAYQAAGDRGAARRMLEKYQEIRKRNREADREVEEGVRITPP